MMEMLRLSIQTVDRYNGSYALFLLALAYITVSRQEKEKRFWCGYIAIALGIFFNPICTKIIVEYCIEDDVYWRYLWIIPIGILISYTAVRVVELSPERGKKITVTLFFLGAIITSGKNIYNANNFQKAENLYKLPQEAVDVSSVIRQAGIQGPIALPEGLRYYVRQYDAGIKVVYSRMVYHTDELTLIEELEKEQPDAMVINNILTTKGCRCIVINANQSLAVEMEHLGYQMIGSTNHYMILQK